MKRCHLKTVLCAPQLGYSQMQEQIHTSDAVSKFPIATASDSKRQFPPLETSPP